MKFYYERVKALRKEQRWTVRGFAKRCGVSISAIIKWESGTVEPGEEKIRLIADKLGVNVNEISDINDAPVGEIDNSVFEDIFSLKNQAIFDLNMREKEDIIRAVQDKITKYENLILLVRTMLNSMQTIFYIKNRDLTYQVTNKAFHENASLAFDFDIRGLTDKDIFCYTDAKKNINEDINVIESGEAIVNKEDYIIGTRRKKRGLVSKYPLRDDENNVIAILANITDITKIKEFELVQQLIMEALDKIDVAISVYEGNLIDGMAFLSGSLCKILGIKERFKGKNITEYWLNNIVHPEDQKEQRNYIESGVMPPVREYRIIHPEKGLRTIKVHTYQTQINNKNFTVALSLDVTK